MSPAGAWLVAALALALAELVAPGVFLVFVAAAAAITGLMLLALPLVAYAALSGFIGKIIILGYSGVLLLVFAGLLMSLIRKGGTVPNKYGGAPTAFSFGK